MRVTLTAAMPGLPQAQARDFDEEHDVVLTQPFSAHHLHRGLVQAGRTDLLLANIRERWGAMVATGSTTIWELWSPLASQCHAWSTTPTFDLSAYVLGVTPSAAGFSAVRIVPQPGDLDWAKGTVPTPSGEIAVRWEQVGADFRLAVTAPVSCALQIVLPFAAAQNEVNGQVIQVQAKSARTIDGLSVLKGDDDRVELVSERGGAFEIRARKN